MAVFAVHYTYHQDQAAQRDLYRAAHRGYLRELLAEGSLLASGPYVDDENPGALLIFQAASADVVVAQLTIDPFVANGLVTNADVREWAQTMGPWA
ncbi:MAG: YciI family protein [Nakamurella sp.]